MTRRTEIASGAAALGGSLALGFQGAKPSQMPLSLLSVDELLKHARPARGLPDEVNAWREFNAPRVEAQSHFLREIERYAAESGFTIPHFYGRLSLNVQRCGCTVPGAHIALAEFDEAQGFEEVSRVCPRGRWLYYGLASLYLVTDDGVGFLVDSFQALTEPENLKFHGIGTGTTAAAQTDSALETESTTALNPNNTRATGSTIENGANVYRTVGTNTVDASVSCTEHGILSQAATGGGTLLDRHVFTAIALSNGDSLQSTYDFTITAGG